MPPSRMRAAAASVAAATGLALPACDAPPRQPADRPAAAAADPDRNRPAEPAAKVPAPDLARIGYEPATRLLVLYPLPDAGAKWMLHVPDQPKGVPVGDLHQFMEDVDVDKVAVFYTTASGQPSPRVSLRDVIASREAQARR